MPLRSLLVAVVLTLIPVSAQAQPDLALEEVARGLDNPVFVAGLPGKPHTLLIVEQGGRIRSVVRGRLKRRAFLDIRSRVRSGNERGLFSLAVHPDWPSMPFVFVNYTDAAGDTVVERYRANRSRRRLRRSSATEVLRVEQPFSNHNGGQLQFGPDGMLYVGMGDGGGAGDPLNAGQDLTTLLGKMLRIDVSALPFVIPADNPTLPGVGRTAIWALGLRNPWRFSFDRETGDLLIADVGQNAREEIDFQRAGATGGANYGWRIREGSTEFDGATPPATTPLIDPIHEYARGQGQSITGGYVYRGGAIPDLAGTYFYADFVTQRIWSFMIRNGSARRHREWTDVLRTPGGETLAVSSFGEDASGEIYVCDYFAGTIYRIVER